MKKYIILCLVLVFALSGCGGKPKGLSDKSYDTAKMAISVADEYLDLKIEAKDAEAKLERLKDRLSDEKDIDSEIISTEISILKTELSMIAYNNLGNRLSKGGDTDVLDARNELAEKINMKKR